MSLLLMFRPRYGSSAPIQPDTHDGGDRKKDYFVWSERDYRKYVLGIKEKPRKKKKRRAGPIEVDVVSTPDSLVISPEQIEAAKARIEAERLALQRRVLELEAESNRALLDRLVSELQMAEQRRRWILAKAEELKRWAEEEELLILLMGTED